MTRSKPILVVLAASLVLGLSSLAIASDEDEYVIGAGHYSSQRWELAIDQFTTYLKAHPTGERIVDAEFYLAEALMQLGKYQDGRVHFDHISKTSEGRFARQSLFRSGEASYLMGEFKQARESLLSFCDRFPHDELGAFACSYLGEIALASQDDKEAAHYFNLSLEKYPDGPLAEDCRIGLAQTLERLNRGAEAERIYRQLAEDPKAARADEALYRLGLIDYRATRYAAALAVWESLPVKFPHSNVRSRASLGRGWALYRLERFGEAHDLLTRLVRDETVGVEAQYWLGMTERCLEQWKQSAETLVRAAAAGEGNRLRASMRYFAGDSLLRCGDYISAVNQFETLVAQSPDSPLVDDALIGKLQAVHDQGNHERVIELAKVYIRDRHDSPLLLECNLILASSLVELGKYQDAIEPLKACAGSDQESPQTPDALADLTTCYLKLNQVNEAKAVFDRLAERYPRSNHLLTTAHALAEAAYADGKPEWAEQLFLRLSAEGNPADSVAQGMSGLAWLRLQAGNVEESQAMFEKLLSKHPRSPLAAEAALTVGQMHQKRKEADAALTSYHQIIEDYPTSPEMPEALLRAALLHDQMGQAQQALVLYTRLVANFPDFAKRDAAIYGLAWAHMDLNHADEALAEFRRIYAEFPTSSYWADSTFRLAKRAAETDQYDEATKLLAKLVDADVPPDILAYALYTQGRIASRRELWEQVEAPMNRLVRELPKSPLCLPAEYSLAEAAYRQGLFEKANESLERLHRELDGKREPWMAMVTLRLGQVKAERQDWDGAKRLVESLAVSFPDFDRQYEANYLLGKCLAAKDDFDGARAQFKLVIDSPEASKTETAAMAQWMIGETYFRQAHFDDARREYLRTETLYDFPKWQSASLLQAGKCLEQLTRWDEVGPIYSRLLKKYPDSAASEEARRRLRVAEQKTAMRE